MLLLSAGEIQAEESLTTRKTSAGELTAEEESLTTRNTSSTSELTAEATDLPDTVQTAAEYEDISSSNHQQ